VTVFEDALDVGTSAMPWKELTVVSIREEFVLKALEPNTNLAALCREFGVSRKTGDKRSLSTIMRHRLIQFTDLLEWSSHLLAGAPSRSARPQAAWAC
jgi:hypothetical protein